MSTKAKNQPGGSPCTCVSGGQIVCSSEPRCKPGWMKEAVVRLFTLDRDWLICSFRCRPQSLSCPISSQGTTINSAAGTAHPFWAQFYKNVPSRKAPTGAIGTAHSLFYKIGLREGHQLWLSWCPSRRVDASPGRHWCLHVLWEGTSWRLPGRHIFIKLGPVFRRQLYKSRFSGETNSQ